MVSTYFTEGDTTERSEIAEDQKAGDQPGNESA